jgi:hypothetical protein
MRRAASRGQGFAFADLVDRFDQKYRGTLRENMPSGFRRSPLLGEDRKCVAHGQSDAIDPTADLGTIHSISGPPED